MLVGEALVAETIPVLARHYALGVVQAFLAVAKMIAASVGIFLQTSTIHSAWRCEFLVAALALVIFKKMKEPEQWPARVCRTSAHWAPLRILFPTRGGSHSLIGWIGDWQDGSALKGFSALPAGLTRPPV